MAFSPETGLRQAVQAPHLLMWLCFGAVIAGAWWYLATVSSFAPGDGFASDLLRSLCLVDGDPWSQRSLVASFVMWAAMILAMMLPSAAPMLATYMDIAEAAEEKTMTVASPFVLCAGYLSIWLVFSIVLTGAQAWLRENALLDVAEVLVSPVMAAAVLMLAGAYQFTPFKHACLNKCAHPMPWFLANWREDLPGVFMAGVRQGGFCVACCWAMMLVMFVTGLMNLFWMSVIGLVMILEKTLANPKVVSYSSGALLIGASLVALVLGLSK